MSTTDTTSHAPVPAPTGRGVVPRRSIGWWALAAAAVGLASWVVLPLITMNFRDTFPVTDTAVMPIIGVVLVDSAAVFNLLAVFRWKQRSVLNIVAVAVTAAAALFFTFIVVAEGLAGV